MLRFAFLAFLLAVGNSVPLIEVRNLSLYVDCQEFIVKGMAYNPVPLGQLGMTPEGYNGTGFCSPKKTPFGDYLSACHDSDYFDGGKTNANRKPPGPTNGWFNALWERDFPILKELGINTLRIYNTNPLTRQYTIQNLGKDGIKDALGNDHIPFMDMAWKNGFHVIFPLISDLDMFLNRPEDNYRQLLRNQIDEVGNHPALLMWTLGNELELSQPQDPLGLANRPDIMSKLNARLQYVREYQMQKWNRSVPITTAVIDLPQTYDWLAENLDVDIFMPNAGYRGVTFTTLWEGDQFTSGWRNLSKITNKPLLIGEFGYPNLENDINTQVPDWFNQQWKDLLDHVQDGAIGGVFFEYSDEPLKEDVNHRTMGVVAFSEKSIARQKSTSLDAWIADDVNKKPVIFDAMKSGKFQNKEYNFNADPFTLLGRTPRSLSQCTAGPDNTPTMSTSVSVTATATSTVSTGPVCQPPCLNGGECVATNTCNCTAEFSGPICNQVKCGDKICNNGGICNTASDTCDCSETGGYTGPTCSQFTCANACENGGICIGPNTCDCKGTRGSGSRCQILQASTNSASSTEICFLILVFIYVFLLF